MEAERARERMVDQLEDGGHVERPSTAAALRAVPQHVFRPDVSVATTYADQPQPIGDGQTVSAPHAVAWIIDELALSPGDHILEVGTGCGYHAAVTAAVVDDGRVWSVECRGSLAGTARERLSRLGCDVSV